MNRQNNKILRTQNPHTTKQSKAIKTFHLRASSRHRDIRTLVPAHQPTVGSAPIQNFDIEEFVRFVKDYLFQIANKHKVTLTNLVILKTLAENVKTTTFCIRFA